MNLNKTLSLAVLLLITITISACSNDKDSAGQAGDSIESSTTGAGEMEIPLITTNLPVLTSSEARAVATLDNRPGQYVYIDGRRYYILTGPDNSRVLASSLSATDCSACAARDGVNINTAVSSADSTENYMRELQFSNVPKNTEAWEPVEKGYRVRDISAGNTSKSFFGIDWDPSKGYVETVRYSDSHERGYLEKVKDVNSVPMQPSQEGYLSYMADVPHPKGYVEQLSVGSANSGYLESNDIEAHGANYLDEFVAVPNQGYVESGVGNGSQNYIAYGGESGSGYLENFGSSEGPDGYVENFGASANSGYLSQISGAPVSGYLENSSNFVSNSSISIDSGMVLSQKSATPNYLENNAIANYVAANPAVGSKGYIENFNPNGSSATGYVESMNVAPYYSYGYEDFIGNPIGHQGYVETFGYVSNWTISGLQ